MQPFWYLNVLLILCAGAARAGAQPKPNEPAAAAPLTVAVLNFENRGQGDPAWDWLAKGLADLTIGDLASQDVKVVSREQMQEMIEELRFRKQQDDPQAVARVLKAGRCIHGTYLVAGGKVQLHAAILDVVEGKQLHTAAASGAVADFFAQQKKLSAELADVVKGNKPGTIDPAKLPQWTESLEASQLLYQGIDRFDRGAYLDAWALVRRALRQDGKYADAHYWSGRMMYYVQEYHQARVDLERFARNHPRHPRAGDAVMEIINAAQLTVATPEEMLDVLTWAGRLLPHAEVQNQFGPGYSSTVGLVTAGLATQILRGQGRFREAFQRFAEHIKDLPVDRALYWIAWHEMFSLKVSHARATGELLPLPPRPRFWETWWKEHPRERGVKQPPVASGAKLPLSPNLSVSLVAEMYGGLKTGGDEPIGQEFIVLTPQAPAVTFDFTNDPLASIMYGRYLCADADHFLTALELEVRFRPESSAGYEIRLEGDVQTPGLPLDGTGVVRHTVEIAPGQRLVDIRVRRNNPPADGRVPNPFLSCKITAKFRPVNTPAGTLFLRPTGDLSFQARLDGVLLPVVDRSLRIEHVPAGQHMLRIEPRVAGPNAASETAIDVGAGEVVEMALSAQVDPRRRLEAQTPGQPRAVNTAYDTFRLGSALGDTQAYRPGDIRCLRDRQGRWIVIWVMRRDLYLSVSADKGRTWAPTTRLPLPVNSAHDERVPVLMQDRDGRYILAFASDRNQARTRAVYVCWSEDLVNFSAPVLVAPSPGQPLRILQRADGTYLLYFVALDNPTLNVGLGGVGENHPVVSTSADLVHWTAPRDLFPGPEGSDPAAKKLRYAMKVSACDIVEVGGQFIAVSARNRNATRVDQGTKVYQRDLEVQTSVDGVNFAEPELVPVSYTYAPGRLNTDNVGPVHAIVAQHHDDDVRVMAVSREGRGMVLHRAGANDWKQVATLNHYLGDCPWGGFLFDKAGVQYFSLPTDYRSYPAVVRHVPALSAGRLQEPAWYTGGQALPLFMYRFDYQPKPLPEFKEPPGAVTATIVRRSSTKKDAPKE